MRPVDAITLGDAAVQLGTGNFDGAASQTILVGATVNSVLIGSSEGRISNRQLRGQW